MGRTMSMYQDFSNQFNNLTLKDILSSNKKALVSQKNTFRKSQKYTELYAKINNILKKVNDNRIFNTNADRYAINPSNFLNELLNNNTTNTQRYIWHIAKPAMRYLIIDEGLLASKSVYKAVFANNGNEIFEFYPIFMDYARIFCYYDFWRIDTFKLNSFWFRDPNRCYDPLNWVCTVDNIPTSALKLYRYNDCSEDARYIKTCSIEALTNEAVINNFIRWRLNKLK